MRTSPLVSGLVAAGLILTLLPPVTAASPVFIDNFSVVRNGAVLFNDPFGDGFPPPSAPNFANGTPASYFVSGDFSGKEGGGLLRLDAAGASVGANDFRLQQALLLTNIDPNNLALGLKIDDAFSVTGIFQISLPSLNLERYGVRLNDGTATTTRPNDLVEMVVRRGNTGLDMVQLIHTDLAANTFTFIATLPLDPNHDEIALTLARLSTSNNAITGCFSYIDAGVTGSSTCFGPTTDIFHGENFTRVEFALLVPPSVPEAPALFLLGSGLAGLAGTAWRMRRRR